MVQMRAAFLDWNEDYVGPKFDLVLACDVLYEVSTSSCGCVMLRCPDVLQLLTWFTRR